MLAITAIDGDTTIGQYKVRVTNDWKKIYTTKDTQNNYYNDKFRLVIEKETINTEVNGKTNTAEVVLPLNFTGSPMNSADVTSPIISKMEKTAVEGTYTVTMNEPIEELKTGAIDFSDTTVEFIGKDKDGKIRTYNGKVLPADVSKGLETKFNVTMGDTNLNLIKDLVAKGGSEDWTLSIKNLTDHIGNKAATVTKDFKITKAEAEEGLFRVAFDNAEDKFKVEGKSDVDTISITFTDNVSTTGKGSAINVSNYTLNGSDLPTGTSIRIGTDNKQIVITVPQGTLGDGGTSNVITLGKNLVSKDGTKLTGEYAFTFLTE